MINLNDKTILVTGASSGIGRETAILASNLGAKLIIAGRDEKRLSDTFFSLRKNDAQIHYQKLCDFSRYEYIESFVDDISNSKKKIDGLVHCAGVSITEPLRLISSESIDLVVDVNLKSSIYLISLLRKKRLLNSGASIIFLSSIMALVGRPGVAVYAATKGAIIALTKSLAAELAIPEKIRVNCLAPAIVKTSLMNKEFKNHSQAAIEKIEKKHLFGFAEPKDIAEPIMFFLSEASRWITGSCLVLDGGYSLLTEKNNAAS